MNSLKALGRLITGRPRAVTNENSRWLLDFGRLRNSVQIWRNEYQAAQPFPHIVLDDFIDPELVALLVKDFHGHDRGQKWRQMDAYAAEDQPASIRKKDSADIFGMSPLSRQLIWELNSKPFLQFLQQLTGIPRIISDPLCHGGGLHEIGSGGFLKVHVDFDKHPIYRLNRRLNLLLYLNEDWKEEFGGDLELWDKDLTRCVQRIAPVAGRCVIFTTGRYSYHGHPRALACPPDRSRKSLALYYYTNGVDDDVWSTKAPTKWGITPS